MLAGMYIQQIRIVLYRDNTLVIFNKIMPNNIVAGIVSKARGYARAEYPGIYTKVSKYLNWISEHTDGECICVNKN